MVNLARINEAKQDNAVSGPSDTPMPTNPEIVQQAELETARECAALYEKHFRNASRQVSWTKAAKECLDAVQADAVAQLSKAAATNESLSSTIESLSDTIDSQSNSISDAQQCLKGSHLSVNCPHTTRATQLDNDPIHMGHPTLAEGVIMTHGSPYHIYHLPIWVIHLNTFDMKLTIYVWDSFFNVNSTVMFVS